MQEAGQEAKKDDGGPVRIVRQTETNLGDLCADAYLDQSGADIAFINGGGIRVPISKGDITLNDILKVHPYGNALWRREMSTGRRLSMEIRKAIEQERVDEIIT